MVKTSLEIECKNCSTKFWYSGNKNNPETTECPNCNRKTRIPEEG